MSSFPTSLDSFTDPTSSNFLNSPPHAVQHANENDAIVAIETKVGIDGSTSPSSIDYKLSHLTSDGWNAVTDVWTYASATTITVPSGAASIYQKGHKIRLKQGAGYLYFYIITVADTLLTITGGSDFTLANAGITDIAYSHSLGPIGFPDWMNYTTTYGGFSANPLTTFKFKIIGNNCFIEQIGTIGDGTSNSNVLTFTLPVLPVNNIEVAAIAFNRDNSAANTIPGHIQIVSASLVANVYKAFDQIGWTNPGGKNFYPPVFSYEI